MPGGSTTRTSSLLDLVFDEPSIGRCLIAPDGSVLRTNAEWLRSTGFSLDDVLGANIIGLFPEVRDMALAMHARARAGHRIKVPRHAQHIEGRETWWEGNIDPVPMEGGIGLLITAREVAAATRDPGTKDTPLGLAETTGAPSSLPGESALATDWLVGGGEMGELIRATDWSSTPFGARERWPQSLRTAVGLVVESKFPMALLWGRELLFLYNDAYRVIAAKKHPAALGRSTREIWPEVWHINEPIFAAVMDRGEAIYLEDQLFPIKRKGFSEDAYFTLSYGPVRAVDGAVVGTLVMLLETTERKRSEQALRESEERFRLAAIASRAMIYDTDMQTMQVSEFAGLHGLLGYESSEVQMTLEWWDRQILPEDLPRVRASLERRNESKLRNDTLEYRLRHRDGRIVYVGDNALLQWDSGGKLVRVVGAVVDITERIRAEEELHDANERLRETDRRKDDFLAVLSHELRNPLAPISNSIHLLHRAPEGSDTARRARDVLQRQTDHLTRLVDDLLDLSRISHGKIELQLARIDARDVVRRTCDDIRTVFEQRSVELRYSQPAEPEWVDADAARLAQMVGNLVANALKFTEPGGQVRVSIRARGQACEINVRDTGTGIEPADLDRIFDPFVQAGRARLGARSGLGIGLALVKDLALKHGGSVRAESEGLGKGAEFVLTLPRAAAPADTAGKLEAGPSTSSLSVLVVEDNEDAGLTLADLLELGGHQAKVAGTGRAGIEAVSAHAPEVLICDVGLPDLSGYEVMHALRRAGSKVFAIALSGFAQTQDRDRALEAGFDAHLAKPPDVAALNELLAEAARRKR